MLVLLSNVLSSLHNPLTQAFCPITVSMHYYPFFSSSWKPSSCKLQGRLVVNGWHVSREIWGKWRWFRKYESMHSTHFSDLITLRRLPKKVNFGWLVFYQSHNIAHDFHSGWIIQLFEENIIFVPLQNCFKERNFPSHYMNRCNLIMKSLVNSINIWREQKEIKLLKLGQYILGISFRKSKIIKNFFIL